jgi:hypothetical protein
MSRSGYVDDYDGEAGRQNLWWGNVARSIRGKRGQSFLHEMVVALDAMPVKELISDELVRGGEVCAIGAVAVARKLDVSKLDPEDADAVGETFGIAAPMAREIVYENDDSGGNETPAQRWTRMRKWVSDHLNNAG